MGEGARKAFHPFAQGWRARVDGASEYDNPYPSGSADREAWYHGWESADEVIAATPAPPAEAALDGGGNRRNVSERPES